MIGKYFYIAVLGWSITGMLKAGIPVDEKLYTEQVSLQLGQKQFISGELIPFSAVCYAKSNPAECISKVLYVELLTNEEHPVIQKVLRLEGNRATSVLQLPDTLQTGAYLLKAYTNWMKNFGDEQFSSTPVYVYNQYDSREYIRTIDYPCLPQVYLQGGMLIDGLETTVLLKYPMVNGAHGTGSVHEESDHTILDEFVTNSYGEAQVIFTPKSGKKYVLTFSNAQGTATEYVLPEVFSQGYRIQWQAKENGSGCFVISRRNHLSEALVLKMLHRGQVLVHQPLSFASDTARVCVHQVDLPGGLVELQVVTPEGRLVHAQEYLCQPDNWAVRCTLNSPVRSRSEISFELDFNGASLQPATPLSVCVSKMPSYYSVEQGAVQATFDFMAIQSVSSQMAEVYPRYLPVAEPTYNQLLSGKVTFPAEDLGMLVTGKILNKDGAPFSNVDVIMAVLDTMGSVALARSNTQGKWAFLVNEVGACPVQFKVSRGGEPLFTEFAVQLDDPFYYSSKGSGTHKLEQNKSEEFTTYLHEEAQRMIIQRAFKNVKNGQFHLEDNPRRMPFYGVPTYVVFPGEYVNMDNFEEIAREILPSVRYKYSRGTAQVSIFDIESNIRYDNPIVLLDGILISHPEELYLLGTKDIQRVEVQSGLHATGNLTYEGLLAVYTTPGYRKSLKKQNSVQNVLPGYENCTVSVQNGSNGSKVPSFENLLYWNSDLQLEPNHTAGDVFSSSDEEGNYLVDIRSFTSEGLPIVIQKIIQIIDAK